MAIPSLIYLDDEARVSNAFFLVRRPPYLPLPPSIHREDVLYIRIIHAISKPTTCLLVQFRAYAQNHLEAPRLTPFLVSFFAARELEASQATLPPCQPTDSARFPGDPVHQLCVDLNTNQPSLCSEIPPRNQHEANLAQTHDFMTISPLHLYCSCQLRLSSFIFASNASSRFFSHQPTSPTLSRKSPSAPHHSPPCNNP